MLSHGATLQNRYRIERPLGQGGMGAVYEATDQRFGTPVALKEIVFDTTDETQRQYMLAAFEREAKSLATIQHECIPFVRDYFSEEEREYLVMELIPGDNLGHVLERQAKPFSIFETLGWLQQLLDALDYLHNLTPPIIHRDIKPHNLKVNARGRLKLLDFGIAKSEDRSGVTTRKQTFIGATLDYSPFEQLLRVMDASFREFIILKHEARANAVLAQVTDERADIFSAGATFYHLVTGRVPEDSTKRTLAVWEGTPDPLPHPSDVRPDIPRPVGDFFLKAMAINRDDRFASPDEMLTALNNTVLTKSGTDLLQERPPAVQAVSANLTAEPVVELTAGGDFPSGSVQAEDRGAVTISNEKFPIGIAGEKEGETASGFSEEEWFARLRAEFATPSTPPPSATEPSTERPTGEFIPSTPLRTEDADASIISNERVSIETPPSEKADVFSASLREEWVPPGEAEATPSSTFPRQSNIETVVLPASESIMHLFAPPGRDSLGRWLIVVGSALAALVAVAAVLIWLGGFLGGTAEPVANRPLTGSANVSAQPEPSPNDALTTASPVPAMTPTANNVPNPNLRTVAPKTKPVSEPPKAKKQKAAPDLNCVYTNSCK